MTSKQVKLSRAVARGMVFVMIALAVGGTQGCKGEQLEQPTYFPSPYPGPKLWAVVPFRNESGVQFVDTSRLADKLTNHLQQTEGIDVVPVNRVIEAMTALEMGDVRSVGDALRLMQSLDVDGLLVGTATAWDPYEPPEIGLIVQLYSQDRGMIDMDPYVLQWSPTADGDISIRTFRQPIAQATAHLDAANGEVLRRLKAYAQGRTPPEGAAGWRRYLLSMDLYSEFAAHEAMRRLFKAEWQRLTDGRQTEEVALKKP